MSVGKTSQIFTKWDDAMCSTPVGSKHPTNIRLPLKTYQGQTLQLILDTAGNSREKCFIILSPNKQNFHPDKVGGFVGKWHFPLL
jgi:hypothetical protein